MTAARTGASAPSRGRVAALVAGIVCALVLPAAAQPKPKATAQAAPTPAPAAKADDKGKPAAKPKEQTFNFDGLGLNGRSRSPQLLYFLERANEELERASLEKRSFIPHLVRTLDSEAL